MKSGIFNPNFNRNYFFGLEQNLPIFLIFLQLFPIFLQTLQASGHFPSGMLGWPQATFASGIKFAEAGGQIECEREVDAGIQNQTLPVPAVVTADLRLNQPRYATLPNLMKAKKKPLEKIDAESLGVDLKPRVKTIEVTEPPPRAGKLRRALWRGMGKMWLLDRCGCG